MKFVDLTGQKFGRLTVEKLLPRVKTPKGVSQVKYLCRCECGNTVEVFAGNLRKGNTKSCGCLNLEAISERRLIDLTGRTFGRLTVISRAEDYISSQGNMSTMWNCKCSCGNELVVNGGSLRQHKQISCGCYLKEIMIERRFIDLTGQKFGKLTAIKPFHRVNMTQPVTKWLCECECGNTTVVLASKLRSGWTKSCGCLVSSGEENVAKILRERNIEFETQYTFKDLKGPNGGVLRFDFAIKIDKQLKALIEYQGKQHYSDCSSIDFGKYQREQTDGIKRHYCSENNIPLFEIAYNDDVDEMLNYIINTLYGNLVPSSDNSEKV